MTTMNATPAAKPSLADFLALHHAAGLLYSAGHNLDAATADGVVASPADWIARLMNERDTDTDVLQEVADVADYLHGAATDLRSLIADAHGYLGNTKAAIEALNRFCVTPTEVNRLALVAAAEPLANHFAPLDRVSQKRLRPFITQAAFRSRINFGSLNYIANHLIDPALIVSNTAR